MFASGAGNPPDLQYFWTGTNHMENVWRGYIEPRNNVLTAAEPMTYAYYHAVKGGKSPKNAPTYQKEGPPKPAATPVAKAACYTCTVCGYIYDPEKGDPDGNAAAGTRFEDLPADWICPVCGAQKDQFTREG